MPWLVSRGIALRADGLDVVAVRIDQECRIVCRAIVCARTGATIVATAGFQPVGMEGFDGVVIGCAKCHMRPAFRCIGQMQPQCRGVLWSEAGSAVVT